MVYYQVTNGSTVKLICTGYLFDINEWNEARHSLFGSKSGSALSVHLRDICERIRSETALLDKVIAAWNWGGSSVSLEDVNVSARASFVTFMNGEIARLRDIGHIRTSETYLSALRSFMRFTHMTDVMLDDIDQDMMMLFGQEKLAKWRIDLLQAQDGAETLHKVGKVYARNHRQIQVNSRKLPVAYYQNRQ